MNYPEVYILRHGETFWNAENRLQGGLNSPLTDIGHAQAARQSVLLAACDLTGFAAICSPQGRAFQTAGIAVAPHIAMISTDERLREIGVGTWQGRLRAELKAEGPVQDGPDGPIALYEQAPEGEGFDRLEARCMAFLDDLSGPSVIVTHGITSRMLRTILLGTGRAALGQLPGGQGNVFHVKDGVQSLIE